MSRPYRLQFAGALYHAMARGNERAPIFHDDDDRLQFLEVLGRICPAFEWRVYAYCLMNNHYHLVFETAAPSLSAGMRDLNGSYAQWFNWRHERVGHLFQGRFRAVLVDRHTYFQQLIRYVVMNPVRAGLCPDPAEWPWSSHRATCGLCPAPRFLDRDRVLAHFDRRPATALALYRRFVSVVVENEAPALEPTGGLLGPESFQVSVLMDAARPSIEVCRQDSRLPIAYYARQFAQLDDAMRAAHASGRYSLVEIARHFGLHYSTVSKRLGRRPARRAATNPESTTTPAE